MECHSIPLDILDDLSSRFIINIPDDQRRDVIRLLFQIEQAHWFYLDFHRGENPSLKACGMKEFAVHILRHIPTLNHFLNGIDNYYELWKTYKLSVPTYGAILLNSELTKVLLVQSYFERTSWGFPKGKVNEDEDPVRCAAREVYEETGFDISQMIKPEEFIEAFVCEQTVRLYVIPGVNEHVQFVPQTRCEIKNVEWFAVNDLPTSRKDMTPKLKMGVKATSFFMVVPFVKRIKNWIQEKKVEQTKRRPRHKSVGDLNLGATSCILVNSNSKSKMGESAPNNTNNSNSRTNKKSKENRNKTNQSRRQLFGEEMSNEPGIQITVQRWLHFQLDKEDLLECFNV